MSENQISQIAKMLLLNLDEIQDYVKNNPKEVEEEQQQENTTDKNDNEQKQCNSTIWHQYVDDTICKIKIDNKIMKGSL